MHIVAAVLLFALDVSAGLVPVPNEPVPSLNSLTVKKMWINTKSGEAAFKGYKPATPELYKGTNTIVKRRMGFVGCTPDQVSKIKAAATLANILVTAVISSLHNPTKDPNKQYTLWFGEPNSSRQETVLHHFENIQNKATELVYDCGYCKQANPEGYDTMRVYVRIGSEVIYPCGDFWKAKDEGRNSKPGMIINTMVQFPKSGWSTDQISQVQYAQLLALQDPSRAILNAANHQYFAEVHSRSWKTREPPIILTLWRRYWPKYTK